MSFVLHLRFRSHFIVYFEQSIKNKMAQRRQHLLASKSHYFNSFLKIFLFFIEYTIKKKQNYMNYELKTFIRNKINDD